jgi:DNA-binding PadR family transcriptional regulator
MNEREMRVFTVVAELAPTDSYGVWRRLPLRLSAGSINVALNSLEEAGYIRSAYGAPDALRGGLQRRMLYLTEAGRAALEELKQTPAGPA